jgi:hypothetical protein
MDWAERMLKIVEVNPSQLVLVLADMARTEPPISGAFLAEFTRHLHGQSPHITLATSDSLNEPMFGFEGDHAYWISSVKVRDVSKFYGTIDVKSWGFGLNDPVPNATVRTFNTDYATGQNISYHNYNKSVRTLNAPTVTTINNQIDITASNISKVVIDPIRARIDCNAVVNVTSDGPTNVVIHGCLRGDVDLNDTITCADVAAVRAALGAHRGDANYVPRADMDDNGVIDQMDVKLARFYGFTATPNVFCL